MNIKKMLMSYDVQTGKGQVLFQMDQPCKCYEEKQERKSIFSLTELEGIPYLNYWNLNQTLLIKGSTDWYHL